MDSQFSITYYMLEDHKKLELMLNQVLDGFGMNVQDIKSCFQEFKDKLEKHMQIEEQAIFSFSNLGDDEAMHIVRELLIEHGVIRTRLEELALMVLKGEKLDDFDDFVVLLSKHQAVEGNVLYPKLDKELKNEEKKFVLQKISSLK